jgi:ATP-dependent DNA helicase RecQ
VTPREALQQLWGYDAFRPLQEEAITAALGGRDSLVVLPTGGGKSLCFQVPAACVADGGCVLVVSPLIALMDDQVAGAVEAGLAAGALHANQTEAQKRTVRQQLESGSLRLLYVSPERLVVGDLLPVLQRRVRLLAVDEAHCISHWGHDFRPEYRQLAPLFAQFPSVPRLALTATATPQVQDDIVAQLALREPLRLIGHIDRPNLCFRAIPRREAIEQILAVAARHPGEGGIVYAQTRKEVERLAEALKGRGVDARPYHAGLDKTVRSRCVSDFTAERLQVVVATVAFGMGIDRSNVRWVVHAALPRSVEHYQQESGRAGRDGDPAECVLLWGGNDFATWRFLAKQENPGPERLRALERQLAGIGRYASAPICRHRLLCQHFGQDYAEANCGSCDVCLGDTEGLPAAEALVTAQKILSAVWRLESRFGSAYVVRVLRGLANEDTARRGHEALSVWGLLRDQHDTTVRTWIDQLVAQGFLVVDDGEYPVLQLTDVGRLLCRGQGEVRLAAPAPGGPAKVRKARKAKQAAATALGREPTSADEALFQRLRTLRQRLAQARDLPPYIVATDAALHALVAVRPTSLAALANCKGWGEKKATRYGAAILTVLAGGDPEAVVVG